MIEPTVLAIARLDAKASARGSMSESLDDVFAGMDAALDRIEEILDRLDRRRQEPDVPLHERGFGVMDEPPTTPP